MFEKLKRLFSREQMSSASSESLDIVPGGFRFSEAEREAAEIRWDEIEEVVGFKRDLLTTDLICIEIMTSDGRVFEFNESIGGFGSWVEQMQQLLPGFDVNWRYTVARPAFSTNRTIIFSNSDKGPGSN